MPRPIIPGDERALNKRIGEALARKRRVLLARRGAGEGAGAAAWAIEDTEQVLAPIYRAMEPLREGLESIENAGPRLAAVVEGLITEHGV
jgi:hypothetical protein